MEKSQVERPSGISYSSGFCVFRTALHFKRRRVVKEQCPRGNPKGQFLLQWLHILSSGFHLNWQTNCQIFAFLPINFLSVKFLGCVCLRVIKINMITTISILVLVKV